MLEKQVKKAFVVLFFRVHAKSHGMVLQIYEKMAEARFQDGDKDKAITHLQRASQAYEAEVGSLVSSVIVCCVHF